MYLFLHLTFFPSDYLPLSPLQAVIDIHGRKTVVRGCRSASCSSQPQRIGALRLSAISAIKIRVTCFYHRNEDNLMNRGPFILREFKNVPTDPIRQLTLSHRFLRPVSLYSARFFRTVARL